MTAEGDAKAKTTFYTSLYISSSAERPRGCRRSAAVFHVLLLGHVPSGASALHDHRAREGGRLRQVDAYSTGKKHGFLPIWTLWGVDNQCMIGTHSVPVVVDAYLKGLRGFDAKKAYAAVRDSLRNTHDRRGFEHWDILDKYGYYPFDIIRTESVSRTLEHAYDDWCAARFAEALGEKDDMIFFDDRSHNWTNVFDTALSLARGRDSTGKWREPFNPFKLNVGDSGSGAKDFTEGNAWQYSWHVMQHPELLVSLHGGKENSRTPRNTVQPAEKARAWVSRSTRRGLSDSTRTETNRATTRFIFSSTRDAATVRPNSCARSATNSTGRNPTGSAGTTTADR
jgi:hypothetical protein